MNNIISIIVPTYKRIDQTVKTIRLIRASEGIGTQFQMELIIADCTPDRSLRIALEKFSGSSSTPGVDWTITTVSRETIIYTRSKKRGISTNKNRGARIANGDILIFCDSDIEVEQDTILNTIAALHSHPAGVGITGMVYWRGGKRDGAVDRPESIDRLLTFEDTIYIEVIYSRYFATYRKIFDRVNGFDEEVFNMRGDGADLSTRYWQAGFPLVYDPSIKVHHVANAPDPTAIKIPHVEWAIARDYFLLAYRHNRHLAATPHFDQTVNSYFQRFGKDGYATLLTGLLTHSEEIQKSMEIIDQTPYSPRLPFGFLEVFTDKKLLKKCLSEAKNNLFA